MIWKLLVLDTEEHRRNTEPYKGLMINNFNSRLVFSWSVLRKTSCLNITKALFVM